MCCFVVKVLGMMATDDQTSSAPRGGRFPGWFTRPTGQVWILTSAVLVLVWGVLIVDGMVTYYRDIRDNEREIRSLSLTLAAHTETTFQAASLLLGRVTDLVASKGFPSGPVDPLFTRQLIDAADEVNQVVGVAVFAADGVAYQGIIRDSRGDYGSLPNSVVVADRDYVLAMDDLPGGVIYIGAPVQSGSSGQWVLPVARPVRDQVGALMGGAAVLIRLETFLSVFQSARTNENVVISLGRHDGMLLARLPFRGDLIGRPSSPETLPPILAQEGHKGPVVVAVGDGQRARLYGSQVVEGYGVRLIISADTNVLLADWSHSQFIKALIGLATSTVILGLAIAINGQFRRRKKSEEALAASQQALGISIERFERAVAGSTAALWELDLIKGTLYFAPQWEALLGWTNIGDPYDYWYQHLHPGDRPRVLAVIKAHIKEHEPFDIEYRLQHADGSWRWVKARGQATWDARGRATIMAGTVHDITDLRRSKDQLRLALEAADDGLWEWDVLRDQLFLDNRCKTILKCGVDAVIGTTGHAFTRLVHPEDRRSFLRGIRKNLRGRHDIFHGEIRLRRADDEWVWVRLSAKVSERIPGGRAVRIVGTLHDITKRRTEMAELRVAKEQADIANRAKSEFLANMSHELRTPLNAIYGFSESLEHQIFGPLNPKQAEYVGDIRASAVHLADLINDILDMAKIESGSDSLREEDVDVETAVRSKVQMIRQRAEVKSVTLGVMVEGLPRYRLDSRKFGQMVLNLLSNAIKFTPKRGRVELSVKVDADGALIVRVSDTGIGIPADKLSSVFDPFIQVDSRLSREYEGTGLGLPLVKAMIEMHGGTVHLDSNLGKGTTATLWFPPHRRCPPSSLVHSRRA